MAGFNTIDRNSPHFIDQAFIFEDFGGRDGKPKDGSLLQRADIFVDHWIDGKDWGKGEYKARRDKWRHDRKVAYNAIKAKTRRT